jgi:lysophospholipase L1-like esterase
MSKFKYLVSLFLSLSISGNPLIHTGCSSARGTSTENFRFAPEIDAFLKEDQVNPPPAGGILFIGSSIFREWTHLREQMAPLPVFNRAFGGSRTADVLYSMDRIVLPYAPRIIVYYCGSNDINALERPFPIFQRIRQFSERVREALPGTLVYIVSINRAPQKKDRWDIVDSTNALVREYCLSTAHRGYIDVNSVLFDKQGNPRLDLYRDDQLHFEEQAYVEFAGIIRPVLEKAWLQR